MIVMNSKMKAQRQVYHKNIRGPGVFHILLYQSTYTSKGINNLAIS